MKSFKTFRPDSASHILWRNGKRVPIAPEAFDVLAYLVDHAGQGVGKPETDMPQPAQRDRLS
jgi:DNA-binding winged helix-turn-helix (wHTH) protein